MNLIREIWQSIVRRDPLSTDKGKSELVFLNVWLHIHPAKVKKENMKFRHTFYLGFITFFLFLILVTTGIALMCYYRPYPPQAYQDMKDLQFVVFMGPFLRNMHRWAAHGMVICVFLHMCRVFYTGSYKKPRQFNWVIGVLLLLLTLGLSFTGYLLPWDQLAYWAITVGTNIGSYAPLIGGQVREILLGGHSVGEAALLRFYVLHVAVLPASLILLDHRSFLAGAQGWRTFAALVEAEAEKTEAAGHHRRARRSRAAASRGRIEGQNLRADGSRHRQAHLRDHYSRRGRGYGLLLSLCLCSRGGRADGDGHHHHDHVAVSECAAGRAGQPGQDAESGQGALVLSGLAGAGQPLRIAGRRGGAGTDGAGAACHSVS